MSDRWLIVVMVIAMLAVLALMTRTAHADVDPEAGADLTGVDGSDQGEPPDVVPDLTVESPRLQEPAPGIWDRLAACESTGRWHINSGNGYYGGLQQDLTFWRRHGGLAFASRPDLATRGQQIAVAIRGQAAQGWGAWPYCSRVIGVR